MSDKIIVKNFHHIEFYCGDATNTYKRFLIGLGMELISKSDQSTGNIIHASYVLQSGQSKMIFTAPYSSTTATTPPSSTTKANTANAVNTPLNPLKIPPRPPSRPVDLQTSTPTTIDTIINSFSSTPFPSYNTSKAVDFFNKHGLAVKSVAIEVSDIQTAYDTMINNGAVSYSLPSRITGILFFLCFFLCKLTYFNH